jgi:hypothetical protein
VQYLEASEIDVRTSTDKQKEGGVKYLKAGEVDVLREIAHKQKEGTFQYLKASEVDVQTNRRQGKRRQTERF